MVFPTLEAGGRGHAGDLRGVLTGYDVYIEVGISYLLMRIDELRA
jgi:hypothetical protein